MDRKTVLLVDDDDVFVAAVSAVLETEFTVRTASNGAEAHKEIEASRPDIVVLDVMMDHLSEGFDVARKIKEAPATASIPVIMLTGVDKVYDTRMEIKDSFFPHDRYLEKPVEPQALLEVIKGALADAAS